MTLTREHCSNTTDFMRQLSFRTEQAPDLPLLAIMLIAKKEKKQTNTYHPSCVTYTLTLIPLFGGMGNLKTPRLNQFFLTAVLRNEYTMNML